MITGLNFDVHATEIASHLSSRVAHHQSRVEFYGNQAKALEDGKAESQSYSSGDPIRNLRDSQKSHQKKAELFAFLASHLVAGETYRLTQNDLEALEFVQR